MTRLIAGALMGLTIGIAIGLAMQIPHDREMRERRAMQTAAILAECEVRTVDGALRLREAWGLLGPVGELAELVNQRNGEPGR